MSGRLEAYEDLLTKAAGKTDKVRDGIEKVMSTLASATAGRGEPWGNDTLGGNFANSDQGYIASKKNILEGATNMAGTFGNFSDGQRKAAEELKTMDHGNGEGFA
ncbi:hypothetical protein [Nocardia concava]|uniref:hypothetical protein n=1 Tax=Nocardia concava TaxID=257281 RepID=UPI00031FBC43|nr:hypothetical protein [Nocardia concava]